MMRSLSALCVCLLAVFTAVDARAIEVAVVDTLVGGEDGGTATVAQLNDDTFFDFTATLVDVSDVDSVAELAAYDVVVLGDLEESIYGVKSAPVAFERDGITGPVHRICRHVPRAALPLAPELAGMFQAQTQRTVRESLCLLYVALTRARERLVVVGAASPGTPRWLEALKPWGYDKKDPPADGVLIGGDGVLHRRIRPGRAPHQEQPAIHGHEYDHDRGRVAVRDALAGVAGAWPASIGRVFCAAKTAMRITVWTRVVHCKISCAVQSFSEMRGSHIAHLERSWDMGRALKMSSVRNVLRDHVPVAEISDGRA